MNPTFYGVYRAIYTKSGTKPVNSYCFKSQAPNTDTDLKVRYWNQCVGDFINQRNFKNVSSIDKEGQVLFGDILHLLKNDLLSSSTVSVGLFSFLFDGYDVIIGSRDSETYNNVKRITSITAFGNPIFKVIDLKYYISNTNNLKKNPNNDLSIVDLTSLTLVNKYKQAFDPSTSESSEMINAIGITTLGYIINYFTNVVHANDLDVDPTQMYNLVKRKLMRKGSTETLVDSDYEVMPIVGSVYNLTKFFEELADIDNMLTAESDGSPQGRIFSLMNKYLLTSNSNEVGYKPYAPITSVNNRVSGDRRSYNGLLFDFFSPIYDNMGGTQRTDCYQQVKYGTYVGEHYNIDYSFDSPTVTSLTGTVAEHKFGIELNNDTMANVQASAISNAYGPNIRGTSLITPFLADFDRLLNTDFTFYVRGESGLPNALYTKDKDSKFSSFEATIDIRTFDMLIKKFKNRQDALFALTSRIIG